MAEKDARRLLENPIPDFPLDYAAGTVDDIIRLTRCQPYLVQLFGFILVNWLNSRERRQQGDYLTATPEDVAYVAREILHEGRPYFWNLWEQGISDQERQILAAIAQTPEGVTEPAGGSSPAEARSVLNRLQQYQLIEQIGNRWRIQVELTRRAFEQFSR